MVLVDLEEYLHGIIKGGIYQHGREGSSIYHVCMRVGCIEHGTFIGQEICKGIAHDQYIKSRRSFQDRIGNC